MTTPETRSFGELDGASQETLSQRYEAELQEGRRLRERLKNAQESAGTLERFAVETDQSLKRAREQIEKLRALHRLSLRLYSAVDIARIWGEAVELLDHLVPLTGITAYTIKDDGLIASCARRGVPLLDLPDDGRQAPNMVSWAFRADNPGSLSSQDGCFVTVPVIAENRVAGAFALARRTKRFDRLDIELAEMVGLVTAQGLEGATRYRAMEEQALTDGLTGVANYRYFRKQMDLEVARAQRFRYPLGLLMADVDHFKKINDQFGHPAGDSALARTAHAMQLAIRRSDVLARVGGEEFAVILPACDLSQARIVAEKLRQAVSAANGVGSGDSMPRAPLTVSVGGAAMAGPHLDAQKLIERADAALLQAKRTGRDRTVLATD